MDFSPKHERVIFFFDGCVAGKLLTATWWLSGNCWALVAPPAGSVALATFTFSR